MKYGYTGHVRNWFIATWILLVLFFFYAVFYTDLYSRQDSDRQELVDYSPDWTITDGSSVSVNGLAAYRYGGTVLIRKKLPEKIVFNDELCFSTTNADIEVRIGDKTVYEFFSRENLTGLGYGTVYHTVNLTPADSCMTVTVNVSSVYGARDGGIVSDMMIGPATAFRGRIINRQMISYLISIFILFAGILIIVLKIGISKEHKMPYDLFALGVTFVLLGLWFIGDTMIPQITTRHIYFWRVVSYFMLPFAASFFVTYIISMMRIKREIFSYLAFILPEAYLVAMIAGRYIFKIDMNFLVPVIVIVNALTVILIILILADNMRYCKELGLASNLGYFYTGIGGICLGIALDLLSNVFLGRHFYAPQKGTFTRLGVAVFAIIMFITVMRWWSMEQASIAKDRLVNRISQLAMSGVDADEKINSVLKFIGEELKADRAYVFEERSGRIFENTYEWCKEGVSPQIENLKDIPYEGVIEVWYREYEKTSTVMIYDLEKYRLVSEDIYEILKPQDINTLITTPLEINGRYIGFFGVDNPPRKAMTEVAEIIRLLVFILSQLVSEKEYQRKLLRYSFYDSLTEVGNRRSITAFENEELDISKPFGFVMCDANGLKLLNDEKGHEFGDEMLKDVAAVMTEVFGESRVFRMGGDEFAAYDTDHDKELFGAKLGRLKDLFKERDCSVSVGAVFCEDGCKELGKIKAEADTRMYEKKREYYAGMNDRRKRQGLS